MLGTKGQFNLYFILVHLCQLVVFFMFVPNFKPEVAKREPESLSYVFVVIVI